MSIEESLLNEFVQPNLQGHKHRKQSNYVYLQMPTVQQIEQDSFKHISFTNIVKFKKMKIAL